MTETCAHELGALEPQLVTLADRHAAVVRGHQVPMSHIRGFYDSGYAALAQALAEQGVRPQGPALAHHLRPPTETVDTELGFVTDRPVTATTVHGVDVFAATLRGGEAAQLTHVGGYDTLGRSWERLEAWMAEQNGVPGERLLEEYLTEPAPDVDPATMRTRLSWFLAG